MELTFIFNSSKIIRFLLYNERPVGKKGQGSSLCRLVSAVRSKGVDHACPQVHMAPLGSMLPTQRKSIGFGKAFALVEQEDA